MGRIKRDSSPEVVAAILRLEQRADECVSTLRLLTLHWNHAVWALLVGGIRAIEQEIAFRGDNTADLSATLQNTSRFVPIAMKWAVQHGRSPSILARKRWGPDLEVTVDEAFTVAHQYSGFETCFPMWHANRYLAELLSPSLVKFTALGAERNRQVSAYQKGIRPKAGLFRVQPLMD